LIISFVSEKADTVIVVPQYIMNQKGHFIAEKSKFYSGKSRTVFFKEIHDVLMYYM